MRWRDEMKANPLLGFMATHLAVGVAVGWAALAALLWLDVGGLTGLIAADHSGWVAVLMLMLFFALTFGSAAMGSAIIGLSHRDREEDTPPRGLRLVLRPVRAAARR
jgi:hypothetical protein